MLNVVYKIGSCCTANRLKKVLSSLINEDETGFISNSIRLIYDLIYYLNYTGFMSNSIRLIYDLIYYLNYNNPPGLLICIDFGKAFDSVEWNFMMKVPEGLSIWSDNMSVDLHILQ